MKPRFELSVLAILGMTAPAMAAPQQDMVWVPARVIYIAPPVGAAAEDEAPEEGLTATEVAESNGLEALAAQCGLPVEFCWDGEKEAGLTRNKYTGNGTPTAIVSQWDAPFPSLVYDYKEELSAPDAAEADPGDEPVNNAFTTAANKAGRAPRMSANERLRYAVRSYMAYEKQTGRSKHKAAAGGQTQAGATARSSRNSGTPSLNVPVGIAATSIMPPPIAHGYSAMPVRPRKQEATIVKGVVFAPVQQLTICTLADWLKRKQAMKTATPAALAEPAGTPTPSETTAFSTTGYTLDAPAVAFPTPEAPAPALSGALASSDSVISSPSQLPSDATVQSFNTGMTISPTSAPDWTEGTPLFGSMVQRVNNDSAASKKPTVYVDGENQCLWVMEQGTGESNVTYINGLNAFVIQNLYDGSGASDVKFGITSASGVNYNNILAFLALNNAFIINNTREITDTSYNVWTSGVVCTKASILFQNDGQVNIAGNKFINNASDHGKFLVGGAMATDGNFTVKACTTIVNISSNTVELGANTGSGDIQAKGGAIFAKFGGIEFLSNKCNISVSSNRITKKGGGDGNTITGGALSAVAFQVANNTGKQVIFGPDSDLLGG